MTGLHILKYRNIDCFTRLSNVKYSEPLNMEFSLKNRTVSQIKINTAEVECGLSDYKYQQQIFSHFFANQWLKCAMPKQVHVGVQSHPDTSKYRTVSSIIKGYPNFHTTNYVP